MRHSAVLFDLDGTLLDTLDDLADAMNHVLADAGLPAHPASEYKYFIGEGALLLVTRALPEDRRDPETIARFLAEFREEYGRRCEVKTRPYRGVPELLDALRDRGVRMAVLSNKPDRFTQVCVASLLRPWSFEIVFGQREGVLPKPDPVAALEVASKLGLEPSRFLYVGDTAIDMRTAVAAGMYPVGVLWGFRPREELESSGARAILSEPMELLELLDL